MRLVFCADLHGNDEQYSRLFAFAAKELVDAVLIGGDIAPKHLHGEHYVWGQRQWYLQLAEHLRNFAALHPKGKVFLMMGNDDVRCNLSCLLEVLRDAGACYAHEQRHSVGDIDIVGYSYVPITPFPLKDWERHDLRTLSPSAALLREQLTQPVSFEGVLSAPASWIPITLPKEPEERSTIQDDLAKGVFTARASNTVYVIHGPPALTKLDVIANGMHVGSIAVREFIEQHQPLLTLHGHIHETVDMTHDYKEQIGRTTSYACGNYETTNTVAVILVDTDHPADGRRIIL